MTICPMRITCRISKAINTLSEYVKLIAFSRQQWLHERSSVLHYTYLACIVTFTMEGSSSPSWMLEIHFVLSQNIPVHISGKLLPCISGLILFIHLFPSTDCRFLRGFFHKPHFPNCRNVLELSNHSAGSEIKSWNTPLYSFVYSALCYLQYSYILLIFLASCFQTPLNYMAQGHFPKTWRGLRRVEITEMFVSDICYEVFL
jgi:hypothetical protein